MKRSILVLLGVTLFLACGAASVAAQSLLDNDFYKQAIQQQVQSQQAYDDGDFDSATALAKSSKENFEKSDAWVAKKMAFYRANGWLQKANERLAYVKGLKGELTPRGAVDEASTDIANAKVMLDAEEYPRSIYLSQQGIEVLRNVRELVAVTPVSTPAQAETPPLPATYTVRLNMDRRDCFWRIAGFPFVYNDPWKWKTLYDANKSLIEDPKNANLIQPGQVFTIPSLRGEVREGEYDPEKTYTPLSQK